MYTPPTVVLGNMPPIFVFDNISDPQGDDNRFGSGGVTLAARRV